MSYVRVSIQGAGPSGEVWSINPVYDPSGELETGVDQAKLDAAALAIANRTVPTSLLTALGTSHSVQSARVEVRADANDALLGISIQGRTTPVSGSGAVRLTMQSALVVSLRTDTPGGSGRGRLYWPAIGVTLANTGRVQTPAMTTFLGDFKNYLAGIDTDLSTAFAPIGFDLAIRSRLTHTTPHVVRLQAGDVVDTQRRRRDALAEAYTQTTYP